MRSTTRAGLGIVAALASAAATSVVLSGPALADPAHAPNLTTGTADCGSAGTFTFLVTGNNGKGTAYNVAFVTSTINGQRALFHPRSIDVTFTSPDGTFHEQAMKPSGPGPVRCEIAAAPAPGVTLSGTVTGWITRRG